jgi:hypothetical protein
MAAASRRAPHLMPDPIRTILATDCGSTTTKAILIEQQGEEYRLVTRGEAPTTVEAPFDVTARERPLVLLALAGGQSVRTIITEQGLLIPITELAQRGVVVEVRPY